MVLHMVITINLIVFAIEYADDEVFAANSMSLSVFFMLSKASFAPLMQKSRHLIRRS